MSLFKSKNPALSTEIFNNAERYGEESVSMTIEGTVNKTALLGIIVFGAALITWKMTLNDPAGTLAPVLTAGGAISGFIVALVIIFRKRTASYLAPVYCGLEGLFLGGLSATMETIYPGIAFQAIVLTLLILFSLLFIYKMGIIKVTENFKLIVASATMGIALFYLVSIIGSFVGFSLPLIHDNDLYGIGFSIFVIIIAAMNLVVDFDFIEEGAASNAPKYMEWYAAFGLMVTLIWLYIEILRLLSKLRSR